MLAYGPSNTASGTSALPCAFPVGQFCPLQPELICIQNDCPVVSIACLWDGAPHIPSYWVVCSDDET